MIDAVVGMLEHVDRRRYRVVHLGGDRQHYPANDRPFLASSLRVPKKRDGRCLEWAAR
jgi:hypothetical protein